VVKGDGLDLDCLNGTNAFIVALWFILSLFHVTELFHAWSIAIFSLGYRLVQFCQLVAVPGL